MKVLESPAPRMAATADRVTKKQKKKKEPTRKRLIYEMPVPHASAVPTPAIEAPPLVLPRIRDTAFRTPPPPAPRALPVPSTTSSLHTLLFESDSPLQVSQLLHDGAFATFPLDSSNGQHAYFLARRYGRSHSAEFLWLAGIKEIAGPVNGEQAAALRAMRLAAHAGDQMALSSMMANAPWMGKKQLDAVIRLATCGAVADSLHRAELCAGDRDTLGVECALRDASALAFAAGMFVENDAAEIRAYAGFCLGEPTSSFFAL